MKKIEETYFELDEVQAKGVEGGLALNPKAFFQWVSYTSMLREKLIENNIPLPTLEEVDSQAELRALTRGFTLSPKSSRILSEQELEEIAGLLERLKA